MMSRFPFGISVFMVCLLSQMGTVSAVPEGSHVTGTVSFRGTLPVAQTMLVTSDAELCGKEALIQTVQVNEHALGLRDVVVSVKILRNTHGVVGKKTMLNVAQVAGSRSIPKTLKRSGLHAIRGDKHMFMTGAFQVFDHPYFAVTDELGTFQLPWLSAGTYTIVL